MSFRRHYPYVGQNCPRKWPDRDRDAGRFQVYRRLHARKGCIMGIEESGGLTVFGHVPEKDGILACLLAVEMLAYNGKAFKQIKADLAAKYGDIYSERTDIKTTETVKTRV